MRIIPKSTKVKMKFYKGIGVGDVILGLSILAVIVLILTSKMPYCYVISIIIFVCAVPLFIPVGDIKVYQCLLYVFKFLTSKKKFKSKNVNGLVPYHKIEEDYIKLKNGDCFGVIEIKPIEFNMLSEYKQNHLIDNVLAGVLKDCGIMQEIDIVKLEKPIILDNYLTDELNKIQRIISLNEKGEMTDTEFTSRVNVIEDRINLIDKLNSENTIYASNYYLIIQDSNTKNLKSSLLLASQKLNANGLQNRVLFQKELAIFLRYSYDKNFDERDFDKLEVKYYMKNIFPNKVRFRSKKVEQNNCDLSHFVITDYPLKVTNGWCEELFDIENTRVVMKLKPVEKYKATKRLDNAISEIASQSAARKASVMLDNETHIQTLQHLLEQLQNDNETLFDTACFITAYDEKGKTTNKRNVRRILREFGFKFTEMFGRQQEVYYSSMLDKTDKVNITRGIPSSTISASFPFISNAVIDEKGIILGENKLPVFIDFFKRDNERVNSNMVIIGKSGSGKSFATKTILTHLASEETKVFILDPENEYGTLTKNLNGKILDVASDKDGIINPFQIIQSTDDENNNAFFAHLQFLEEFFRLILQGISPDCFEILNKLILEMYNDMGINEKTNLNNLQAKDYPIFDNLVEKIENKTLQTKDEYTNSCLKVLLNYLSKFKSGGRNSNIWNGYSTFNLKENFICFNFQKLLANKNNVIANAQMLLVLKWIENEVIKNRENNFKYNTNRKIVVAIDEAHVFIDEKFPVALDFMYQLAKRIRKYNGMQIVITQNVKDFVGSPELIRKSSAIINVSQYSFIFSLAPNDIKDLCSLYEKTDEINEVETDNIVNLGCGSAFLITSPQKRTNIKIVATPTVQAMFEEKKN